MDSGAIPSRVSRIVPTADGKFVMVESGDKGKVVFLNTAGQVEASVDLGNFIDVVEFVTFAHPLPDSGLLTVVNFLCASIQSRILNIQANGQISIVEVPYWSSDGLNTAAYPLPDDTFVLYDLDGFGNAVARIDSEGQLLWERNFNATDVELLDSTHLLFATPQGLVRTDLEGLQDTLLSPLQCQKVELLPNGHWLLECEQSLQIVSAEFETLAEHEFATDIVDYKWADERIAVLAENNQVHAFQLDLQPLLNFSPQEKVDYSCIALLPDGFLLAGYGSRAPFAKKYNTDGSTPDYSQDIGVTSISLPEPPVVGSLEMPEGTFAKMQFPVAAIEVKNFGTDTINRFWLTSFFPTLQISWQACKYEYFNWKKWFNNISLAPGESKVFQWSIPDVWFTYYMLVNENPYELCIAATAPNNRLDRVPENDKGCVTTVLTDIDLPPAEHYSFSAFPNPSAEPIQLDCQFPRGRAAELTVFNTMGQEVWNSQINHSGIHRLPSLPPGVYIATLWVGTKYIAQQRIVQY